MNRSNQTILDVEGLRVEFRSRDKTLVTVKDISFQVNHNETLGIIEKSGSIIPRVSPQLT